MVYTQKQLEEFQRNSQSAIEPGPSHGTSVAPIVGVAFPKSAKPAPAPAMYSMDDERPITPAEVKETPVAKPAPVAVPEETIVHGTTIFRKVKKVKRS